MTAPLRDLPTAPPAAALLPRDETPPAPLRLSELLTRIASDPSRDRIRLADLLAEMKARAFGALLLVIAFPNILPAPPGVSGLLGVPLLFLAVQMMLGQDPWLPRFIADRAVSRDSFAAMVARANPWLQRAERLLRARLRPLAATPVQRVLGALVLLLALALALPIPFANMAPAVAICVIALGILERDGLSILIGAGLGIVVLGYVAVLGIALAKSAAFVLMNAF